jgi:thiol:disulfide interchange protein DsbC
MRLRHATITTVLFALAQAVLADEAAIRHAIGRLNSQSTVTSISGTPVAGIFEVVVDHQIVYVSEDGRYMLGGPLVNTANGDNLTHTRFEQINAIPFDRLPLDWAIKRVKGNGSRKLAIFEDPYCTFCRKLEQDLRSMDNLTIYVFLFPIDEIHPGAAARAAAIWCARDRGKAWDEAMRSSSGPGSPATCDTPVAKIIEYGHQHGITGTPTLFLEDGRRVIGAVPPEQLERELARAQKK